ncbi:MAG TPA: diacylglycerol kinase family protein [Gemmatimonadales bacterium]
MRDGRTAGRQDGSDQSILAVLPTCRPSVLIIANPTAGRGRARGIAVEAARRLEARGLEVALERTDGPGHARELAAGAVREGTAGRLLVVGGDGTVSECAAGLARTNVALGILPCGRGNDLAAALGIPRELGRALEVFQGGSERQIDLGLVNGRPFCTVAGIGFDAHVAERVRAGAWRALGGWAYTAGVLAHLFTWRTPAMRLEGDFGVVEGRFLLAAVSNTGRYGGGIEIAPGSRPDDGALDCCLVRDGPRLRLLRIFPTVFGGRHVRFPEVEMRRTCRLVVEADRPLPIVADGEPVGTTPATLGVDPLAVRVVVPRAGG